MRSVSGRELCHALERHGWELRRVHGSHHIYVHPDRPGILTVPVHGNHDLKTGLLHRLLKAAGLSEQDL